MIRIQAVAACLLVSILLSPGPAAADETEQRFRSLDRDGDGKLSREELPAPRAFSRLDRDGDGFLSLEEVRTLLERNRGRGRRPAGSSEPPAPSAFSRHPDIPYAEVEGVDPNLQSLDLYEPKGPGKHPVLVMIHGGGWRRGDKGSPAMTEKKVPHFVGSGYVYVSVNYRLSNSSGVKHPAHVEDVARALAWVHQNVAKYGGDPDRIFVMGHSAGAHLAALVATDHRRLASVGKPLTILKGVICLDSAAYDVPRYVNELEAAPQMRKLYEIAFGSTEDAWRDASPRHHVAEDKGIPPMLLFHTGARMAGEVLSGEFATALREAGTPARAIHAADRDHAGINSCIGEPGDPYTALVMRFLAHPESASSLTLVPPASAPDRKPEGGAPLTWTSEYGAGTRDRNGRFMGGTETMRLVAHEGMLFAGIGYWTDQPAGDPRPGGQVLVKRTADAPWELEREFPDALRVNCMESFAFRSDHAGKTLQRPVNLLVADASLIAGRKGGPLVVWVRDKRGWHASLITRAAPSALVRAFGFHRDETTGVDLVFAGTRAGEIYAGAYDASVPGGIRWNPEPEYRNPDYDGGAFTRVSAFCEANGKAYCSVAPHLVRRTDGSGPAWREVYRWNADLTRNQAGLRGITAVPSPDGEHEVILGAWERPGHILRIDPAAEHAAELEIDSRAFLRETLGGFRGGGLTAYNRFVPGAHPRTGEPIHWVTVAGYRPGDGNAAWLLIRNADATYETVRVADPDAEDPRQLISTRTIEVSPWDRRVIYTGGFDGAANNRKNHNSAWIQRGVLPPSTAKRVVPPRKPESGDGVHKAFRLRFGAMDRDGDGGVTPREFPNRTIFGAFDLDRNGRIDFQEFLQLLGKTSDRGPIAPQAALTKIGKKVEWFSFEKDYFPGTRDPKGQLLGGTELMRILAHDGKLFAATSMLKEQVVIDRSRDYPGPQILRKDSSRGPWVAEKSFGRDHIRVNCLEVLTFSKDYAGRNLSEPVSLLAAGLYDIRPGSKTLSVAVRDDSNGAWTVSRIAPLPEDGEGFAGIRSLVVHENVVFAGADYGGIYRGAYDPSRPGRIRWIPVDELSGGTYGRPVAMAICDGALYAALGYGNQRRPGKQGGLFRRAASGEPRWELVHSWFEGKGRFEYLLRGLTSVEVPEAVPYLLGAIERPPLPVIRRILPAGGHVSVDEINYENYFANVFGAWPNVGVFMNAAALNRFVPFPHPETGETVHLVATFVVHPRSPEAGYNGAYFLVRDAGGSYDWGEVRDPGNLSDGERLQGLRTICRSPFPEDHGGVYFFGGFAADYAYVRDTAWIYRATLRSSERTGAEGK